MKAACTLLLALLPALGSVPAAETPKEAAPKLPKPMEEQTQLQIFLDRANFGPGKIDGKNGEFTQKALQLYRETHGLGQAAAPPKANEGNSAPDTAGIDLSSVQPVFVSYTVSTDDLAQVASVPEGIAAESKVKYLAYRSLWEELAEKFHSDEKFLKELNPSIKGEPKEGDAITVPNVEPFEVSQVKQIKPGEDWASGETIDESNDETADQNAKPQAEKSAAPPEIPTAAESGVSLDVDVASKMLTVHKGKELVAAFPVTPGSTHLPSPIGHWKVQSVAKMPNFRWDEKMLNEGVRSSNAHLLPPGPNNPVGVIWIALNKKGIGIHGTEDPETIGRAGSHGCIRLANWDVVKLAKMVTPGTPVDIETGATR